MQLLANPIQNTLSQLTQTIRFLAANDMLRNVETRPGQAAEQAAEREKVVLVEEVGVGGEVAAAASPADAETQAETQAAQ
jgi:hypothetical protein